MSNTVEDKEANCDNNYNCDKKDVFNVHKCYTHNRIHVKINKKYALNKL